MGQSLWPPAGFVAGVFVRPTVGLPCCTVHGMSYPQEYGADVVLHFGMHGTVEWLPGSPLGNTGGAGARGWAPWGE